jgi:uncharacterized protein YoxC|nr:MAG TPA: tail protein [Caudoviricetes sp.]
MYAASTSYKNYIASSRVRVPKSKIVVGNATYTGQQYLKTYPKISHSNSKMIGGFPAKSCEFEIYNLDGSIDLNGKEVSVYRGLEINGSVTWIPLGLFTAKDEDITNSKTARSISFKGTDRAVLFDCAYGGSLTYPTTLGAFVKEICQRHGVALETATFPMSTFKLTEAPNMDASVTDRELISRAAELGGCIAQISRTGGLRISKPVSTGIQIGKARYKAVSKEPKFGVINSLVFGHDGYDDDITYPSIAPENLCQWRIDDNPFIDKTRESSIKTVAAQIFGMSIMPFQITDCIDDYIFDLNDTISVQDKDGTYFTATVLQIETTARIRSKLSAEAQTVRKTDYKMAGSVMQTLKKVQLQVDHQNLSIQTLVQDVSGLSGEVSTLKQTASSIQSKVTKIEGDYVTSSTIEQLSNEINVRFNSISELNNATTTINAQGIKVEDGSFTAESDAFKTDLSGGYLQMYYATNMATGTNYNYLTVTDAMVDNHYYATFASPLPSIDGINTKGFRFGESDENKTGIIHWQTDYALIEKARARFRQCVEVNEILADNNGESIGFISHAPFGATDISAEIGATNKAKAFMQLANNSKGTIPARINIYSSGSGGAGMSLELKSGGGYTGRLFVDNTGLYAEFNGNGIYKKLA